jgi:O-antigen/teichoic acid export membrane protein
MLTYFGQEQLFFSGRIDLSELHTRNLWTGAVSTALLVVAALTWPHLHASARICALLIGLGVVANRLLLPYFAEPTFRLDFSTRAKREMLVLATWPVAAAAIGAVLGGGTIAFASGYAIAAALPLGFVYRRGSARRVARVKAKRLLEGLPFALSNALYLVYFQSDVAIMGSLAPSHEVGLYAAACSLLGVAIVPSSVLMNDVMRPRLYKHEPGTLLFRSVAVGSRTTAFALGLVVAAAVAALAPTIVSILFGARFQDSVPLLRILCLAICLYYWSNWASNVLIGAGRAKLVVVAQLILAIANIALNIGLIPTYGAAGSAWITAVCEAGGLAIFAGAIIASGAIRDGRAA